MISSARFKKVVEVGTLMLSTGVDVCSADSVWWRKCCEVLKLSHARVTVTSRQCSTDLSTAAARHVMVSPVLSSHMQASLIPSPSD